MGNNPGSHKARPGRGNSDSAAPLREPKQRSPPRRPAPKPSYYERELEQVTEDEDGVHPSHANPRPKSTPSNDENEDGDVEDLFLDNELNENQRQHQHEDRNFQLQHHSPNENGNVNVNQGPNVKPRPPSGRPKNRKKSSGVLSASAIGIAASPHPPEPITNSNLIRRVARPPSKGKGVLKKYESMFISNKDVSNPLGEVAEVARVQGLGSEGVFGYHCYNCKTQLYPPVNLSEEKAPLFMKCINCDRISCALFACRFVPFEKLVEAQMLVSNGKTSEVTPDKEVNGTKKHGNSLNWGWICYSRKNCLHWTKMLSSKEETQLTEEIENLRTLDLQALTNMLSEEWQVVDVDSLESFFPLERKEELVQYVMLYRKNDIFRVGDGYLRELMRSGEVLWSRVGNFRMDPSEFMEYGDVGKAVKFNSDEIAALVCKPFNDRFNWFKAQLEKMFHEDEYEGPLRITVHRDRLLEEASNWINALHDEHKWRSTRYEFYGEPAMDSGGVAKEWYRLVCDSVFQPQFGLFSSTSVDDISYDFNPNSGLFQPERHLHYFRFAGRILAKAIFEGCFVQAHLTKAIYKHILGRPLSLKDLKFFDKQIYESMIYMLENPDEVADLGLTFIVNVDSMGVTSEVELKPNGRETEVNKDNLHEYIKLYTKFYLYDRCKLQLNTFLKGFHEIIPPPMLVVFDHNEFENIMCGKSEIDVEDWRRNVTYRGVYKEHSTVYKEHKVIKWFWEIVSHMTEEEKSKLLQFLTGSSRVPVGGFKAFADGKSMLISIESITLNQSVFPRAHTCFNRLELPLYNDKDEMRDRVMEVLNVTNGFNLE